MYWCIDLQPEYAIALAADQARNEREERDRATTEARVVVETSADYSEPEESWARRARLSHSRTIHDQL